MPAPAPSPALALRVLSVCMGVFLLAMGLDKLSWLTDTSGLTVQLDDWLTRATPPSRWYIETIARPGAPVFPRLVLIGEVATGAALLVGYRVRIAAIVALFMVLNFHFAFGALLQLAYLKNGYGPPKIRRSLPPSPRPASFCGATPMRPGRRWRVPSRSRERIAAAMRRAIAPSSFA